MRHWIFIIALMLAIVPGAVNPVWAASPTVTLPKLAPLPQISSVTLNPSSVIGGTAQVLGTVTLNQPAPAGGVAVVFRSSNPAVAAVPPGVTVQPGATSATFVVQPLPVAVNPNVVNPNPPFVQISAQIGNSTPVIAQLAVLPPTMVSLTLNPTNVPGGTASTGTVTITGPAPSGGIALTLSPNAPTTSASQAGPPAKIISQPVTVPSQVTIPAGATSASFPITTRAVSASTAVQINVAWGVFVTKTATLTLLPPEIASLCFPYTYGGCYSTTSGSGGHSYTAQVTLTGPAPSEGITVPVQAPGGIGNDPCVPAPTVPLTVHIAGGAFSATFPISTFSVSRVSDFYIHASYANNTGTAKLTLGPPSPVSLTFSPPSVKGGTTVQGIIGLPGPVLPYACNNNIPFTVDLALANSGDTLYAQFAPHVVIVAGKTQATFNITTSAVSSAKNVVIQAATDAGGITGMLTITP